MTLAFTKEQWEFLATLEALGEPVSVDLVGFLSPLMPGPLFDLLVKTEKAGWIKKINQDHFSISPNLPETIRNKIRKINNKERLGKLAQQLLDSDYGNNAGPFVMAKFMDRAGRIKEATQFGYTLAFENLDLRDTDQALAIFAESVERLFHHKKLDNGTGALFVSGILYLSNLCFALGRNLQQLEKYLHYGHKVAAKLGDRRSHALINLHLGRQYYFSDRRADAMVALSAGLEEINELGGDEDLLIQSADFSGLYYFMTGHFREALNYLERIDDTFELGEKKWLMNPLVPILLGDCALYLGQFHRAIGSLDFHWRLAKEKANPAFSTTVRAVLGTALALVKKNREASIHLEAALTESAKNNNAMGHYFARGGRALLYRNLGKIDKAYAESKQAMEEGRRAGLIRQFSSPWIMELSYDFHRLGFDPVPDLEFSQLIKRSMDEANVHLRGVALRLQAREKMNKGEDSRSIESDLSQSREYLEQSGDPIQLAKTILETARYALKIGNREKASYLAKKAWRKLGGYAEDFFPDELRPLLEEQEEIVLQDDSRHEFFQNYLDMLEAVDPDQDHQQVFNKVVIESCRLFNAERGGLFWFHEGKFTLKPELRATNNLTVSDAVADHFRPFLDAVLKTFRTNKPMVMRIQNPSESVATRQIRAVLCIPIADQGMTHGVLYLDNSYLSDTFDFLDTSTLVRIARNTSVMIGRIVEYRRLKEKWKTLSLEKMNYQEQIGKDQIVTDSQSMIKLLKKADHAAGSKSTILILGETGTGKELLARRIHQRSTRSQNPFIVIDATTIPENLMESELFGYEKGAFTGADQRKIGRIEQAHQGSLFLDEIGELSLAAQSKLLRALQEKTFTRVGGIQTLSSDFRLIAATNRDLNMDVSAGRFRKDLFYRLNVVPLTIPPLRERKDDIIPLACYFLNLYGRKYGKPGLKLTGRDEKNMIDYPWSGNVRELENVIERAVIMSETDLVELSLPLSNFISETSFSDKPTLDELQRRYIKRVLEITGGKIGGDNGAAAILGMKRPTLYSRMRQLGMTKQ
ncbi:MAG: hypothetical protein APR62_14110 [Smithella sp. SDB]|nr:MAG: hypothetical protein APR62_14110 [Smithella sp. SDB]